MYTLDLICCITPLGTDYIPQSDTDISSTLLVIQVCMLNTLIFMLLTKYFFWYWYACPQRNGADFSVFVNTAQEFDGSDSGARPDEAVSWGKIKTTATPVKVIIPGGTLDIYWWGCAAAHPKRGVLGTGTTQKRGVLGTGTTQKRGS